MTKLYVLLSPNYFVISWQWTKHSPTLKLEICSQNSETFKMTGIIISTGTDHQVVSQPPASHHRPPPSKAPSLARVETMTICLTETIITLNLFPQHAYVIFTLLHQSLENPKFHRPLWHVIRVEEYFSYPKLIQPWNYHQTSCNAVARIYFLQV